MGRTIMMLIQLAVLLSLLGVAGCNSSTEETESVSGINNPQMDAKILQAVARRMKSTLPQRLDEMTTMVDVESSDLTLTFFYVIDDLPFGKIDEDDAIYTTYLREYQKTWQKIQTEYNSDPEKIEL